MVGWGRGRTAGVGWKARQGMQGLDKGLGRAAGRKGDQYSQLRLLVQRVPERLGKEVGS